ncbi:MAG: hypothetical protein IJW55_00695 [Clostridia bacterium]|nr:hypothetical protein [Clostridia bacterium]
MRSKKSMPIMGKSLFASLLRGKAQAPQSPRRLYGCEQRETEGVFSKKQLCFRGKGPYNSFQHTERKKGTAMFAMPLEVLRPPIDKGFEEKNSRKISFLNVKQCKNIAAFQLKVTSWTILGGGNRLLPRRRCNGLREPLFGIANKHSHTVRKLPTEALTSP